MNVRVKLCGMTRASDIEAAERLHVDFIGFVFVPSSPRAVTIDQARALRRTIKSAKVVGVFEGNSPEEIRECIKKVSLDYVQIYGFSPDEHFSVPVIAAFRGIPDVRVLEARSSVLIDKVNGEEVINLEKVAALPSTIRSKLFLAGGLKPENVRHAIETVHPFAVDCARGIESAPGEKNADRMTSFFSAAGRRPALDL